MMNLGPGLGLAQRSVARCEMRVERAVESHHLHHRCVMAARKMALLKPLYVLETDPCGDEASTSALEARHRNSAEGQIVG